MNELIELRILEKHAPLLLKDNEGVKISDTVRKLTIETNSPLYKQIGEINHQLQKEGEFFYLGWDFIRRYTKSELNSAQVFHLIITAVFEPVGEECGTIYDESTACKICQAGRTQVSDLILDLRKVPKKKDIAKTIADECIISQRLAEILVKNKISGFELRPIRHKARFQDDPINLSKVPSGQQLLTMAEEKGIKLNTWEFDVWLNSSEQHDLINKATEEHALHLERLSLHQSRNMPIWYQLTITSQLISIIPPTEFGIKPFDKDPEGQFRCPLGHVSGLNLLSELWLSKGSWDGSDVCRTAELVGVRRGVLVPSPMIVISPRLYRLLKEENIKGYKVEIAHI